MSGLTGLAQAAWIEGIAEGRRLEQKKIEFADITNAEKHLVIQAARLIVNMASIQDIPILLMIERSLASKIEIEEV